VFVEALGAGPRVLARRAEVLDRVAGLVDEGRAGGPVGLPSLVGAGVVGAAFSIVHARLLEQHPGSLMELVNPVMATVVLPYQGRECSARELARAVPELPELPEPAVSAEAADRVETADRAGDPGSSLDSAEPGLGRVRSPGRGKSARTGRSAGAVRRRSGRGAIEGGVLLAGMNSVEYRRILLLRAAAAAVDEHGYGAVTVAHITARAKISRRTFYELFVDREQCLLAVMEDIEQQLTNELRAVDLDGLAWRERVRLGLWTVLRFFDREPGLARFCVVESGRGDDRMAAYRAELLARIAGVIAEGGEEGLLGEHSLLAAEGVAGAVVSILSTRLAATGRRAARRPRKDVQPRGALSDLLGELMALIVLPYLGSEAAREERARPAPATMSLPVPDPGSKQGGRYLALDPASSPGLQMRMTYRTALVLEAIAQAPGISNLGVAGHAQINDQGQVSKLLARLERNGLVQNTGRGHAQGAPNEWRLTPAGEKVERGIREHQRQAA
jgi:AcrR family transcriptional regulator/DNA-binding MarR family transcriptional regulator